MRIPFFAMLASATIVAVPASAGTNLVTNGNFETGYSVSTEFNTGFNAASGPTGWTSAAPGFNLYLDPTTATTVDAISQYSSEQQRLAPSFTGASPAGGYFVALDGDVNANGALSQLLSGLTVGKKYDVSFYWAATQLSNRSGETTERLDVSFGGTTQSTATITNPSQGFSGWQGETFSFIAGAATQTLSFLSVGTPTGLPPMAVLDGVSVTAVPEPATWALMLAGFGMVGFAVRRRRIAVVAA